MTAHRGKVKREPTNLQAEPPYPGLDTVVFSLRDPNCSMTVHCQTERCRMSYPHYTEECGEWAHEVGKLLPKETPRGVFEYRVKAALSVAHMSPKVTFEVILLALQCYESDSAYGEVRS